MQVRTGNKPEQRSDLGPTQDLAVYTVHTEVERRVLTADELAARVTAAQALREPRLHEHRPSAGMAVMRPASRSAQGTNGPSGLVGVGTPAQTEAPTAPVAIKEEPTVSSITTIEPESPGLPDIPCRSCVHATVCRWEPEVAKAMYSVAELKVGSDPAIRIRATVECDHHAPAKADTLRVVRMPGLEDIVTGTATQTAPVRLPSDEERAAASRQRGNLAMLQAKGLTREEAIVAAGKRHPSKAGEAEEKARRAAECLAALERHAGDRAAAAAELGIRPNAFAMIVKHAALRETVGAVQP